MWTQRSRRRRKITDLMDSDGVERDRIEGYLPNKEFRARLEMALARVAFTAKRWDEAEKRYTQAAERYPDSAVTAEAIYWRGVSHYKGTNDHTILGEVAQQLSQKFPNSEWTQKASVWAH